MSSNWYKSLTEKGVEVKREDDIDKDTYWIPLKNSKHMTAENKEWILNLLKENNFDEKLEYARNSGKDYITLYYDPFELPKKVRLLEMQFINYLSNSVDDFKGAVGVIGDINCYKTGKARLDIII